jgi:hypothetical protein
MLTDAQCRTATPREKPYKLPDGKGLYLEVKPNGVKAWRYRFKLAQLGAAKESMFAIGDYAAAPAGETPEQAKSQRDGWRFTLAEARDERTKARAEYRPNKAPFSFLGPSLGWPSPVQSEEAFTNRTHRRRRRGATPWTRP